MCPGNSGSAGGDQAGQPRDENRIRRARLHERQMGGHPLVEPDQLVDLAAPRLSARAGYPVRRSCHAPGRAVSRLRPSGEAVSSIYMIPLKDMNAHKASAI